MSNADWLKDFDPTQIGDESGYTDLVSGVDNIGTVAKTSVYTFPSGDMQAKLTYRIDEGVAANKGKQATLAFPIGVPTKRFAGGTTVSITETQDVAAARNEYRGVLARILSVTGLPAPTEAQLGNDMLAQEWLQAAEGSKAVFSAYTDKNGYGAIPCQAINSDKKKAHAGISRLDAPVYDKPGKPPIPGFTRETWARKKIAEWKA